MSESESLDLKNLHVTVMQEFQTEEIQELSTDFFRNLSNFIGNLKNEEYDGVEEKIKNSLLTMVTETTSLILKLRLKKAISTSSNHSMLLDEEKYILDSQKEMEERKGMILSGILSGKTKLLESTTKNQKPQDD